MKIFKLIGALSLTPLQSNDIYVINLMVFKNQYNFAVFLPQICDLDFIFWLDYVYIGVIVYQYVGMLRLSGGLHFKSVYWYWQSCLQVVGSSYLWPTSIFDSLLNRPTWSFLLLHNDDQTSNKRQIVWLYLCTQPI